ncbi:MAG: UvrD-helicase domain-containing protein, partial [Clostridium sp.]
MANILNEKQNIVVNTLNNNILLLASAGTGKTNTLVYRVNNIIESGKCNSSEILCITFTNKACREMKERIESMNIKDGNKIVVRTFHSFCYDVIKNESKKHTDIFTDFIIFDEEDCKEIIKTVNYYSFQISSLQNFISLVKEHRGIYKIYSDNPLEDYKKIITKLYNEKEEKINEVCRDDRYSIDFKMKD